MVVPPVRRWDNRPVNEGGSRPVKNARLLVVLTAALVALAVASVAAGAEGDEKITLTVGLTQDLDSPNVTAGFLVSSYELWNLHYATLTDKAAADFATEPGLAESWEMSNGGKTYTYTLREGLEWSDGTPLTAEDVAYTINRSRDEEWINHSATVANLDAKAIDERTVEIASKVNDPKLPTMDVYIVPKHIYEKIGKNEITKYAATDGVGSGPFAFAEWKKGQFWRMTANDAYWGGRPAIDEVVFRVFRNADAMVAALEKGEIDAAHSVPAAAFKRLETNDQGIVAVEGQQGGFDEIGLNAGLGGQGQEGGGAHPALLDIEFRKAIMHAIDRETLVERVYQGLGTVAQTISPSPNPAWIPELAAEEIFEFDLAKANSILDAAGYKDTDGNGTRNGKDGKDIVLRYALRTESEIGKPLYEFVSGWLEEIGIRTTVKGYDDGQLTPVIGKGDYDIFAWGWTPFVDPDPILSYFTCGQLSKDPDDPSNYYNDASWCSEEYDALYEQQNQELDPAKRTELVHEMLKVFYASASYAPIIYQPDLQAYRTDRFEGWLRQPAETGPVLFSNTSPTYVALTPIAGSSSGGGTSTGLIVALVALGAVALAAVGFGVVRRRGADERE
jgi:peptide/nickel transport system substrate-binding protein